MGRLPAVASRQVIAALRRAGCEDAPRRGKGSHRALIRRMADGGTRIIIVPNRQSLPRGTLRAILKQAGLTPQEFLKLL